MSHNLKIISTLMLASALLAACGRPSPSPPAARKHVIVVTVYPLANLVDQLVGDWAAVRTLPDRMETDPVVLGGADVLIVSGTPGDEKIESDVRFHSPRRELELLRFTELAGDREKFPAAACPWLDPLRAAQFVTALAPHLQRLVPDRAAPLRNRVMLLRTDLLLLHQEFAARFGDGHRRKIAAWDATFDSMTARFNIDTVVHAAALLAESKADDGGRLDSVADAVRASGAANLIAPIGDTDPLIGEIARRAGVTVLRLDPIGGPEQPERSTYGKLIRWNLEAILAAGVRK